MECHYEPGASAGHRFFDANVKEELHSELHLTCLAHGVLMVPESTLPRFAGNCRQWPMICRVALIALTREVPERISDCELTHLERMPIDRARAVAQHDGYEAALRAAGCCIERLPPAPDLPDSVFVEDTAVVFDEVAVMTRSGALSRRAETASVAGVLAKYRPVRFIGPPATLDGGDVLRVGRRVFVGLSSRTNRDGVEQLRALLRPFDYSVETAATTGCLHLKSAVTALADDWLLVNGDWIDVARFAGFRVTAVDPAEPFAANVLRVGQTVLCAEAAPRTRARLDVAGVRTAAVDISELAKAEAGLTCCSLIVAPPNDPVAVSSGTISGT